MSDFVSFEHLCESVYRMGVPINTLLILLYQILLFGSISGLPFASISSLPSLKTSETASNEELTPAAYVANLVNTENLVSTFPGSQSSNNFQLFVGLPFGNTNYVLYLDPSLIQEISNGTPSPDTSSIQLPTAFNIQPNTVSFIPVSEPSSSPIGVTLEVAPSVMLTSTSTSNLSAIPVLNEDFKSNNLKRELRDTISVSSQEPCFTVTQQNLARLTSDCVSNFPSPVFPSMPLLPNIKPMFSCVKMPEFSSSEDLDESLDGTESECALSSPFRGSILTNVNPNPSFKNNLLCPQDNNPNMLLALNLLNKRVAMQNSGEIDSAVQSNSCSESSETITSNALSTSVNNPLSFTEIKNYIDSKQTLQSDRIPNQPNIQTNLSPCQMSRLNNNLMDARVPQNNIITSQISQGNVNCENTISQGRELNTEYENVLRIRNSVMPNMLSNIRVKSIPKTMARNNNVDTQGCPQLETVSVLDNKQDNNNIHLIPTNECESENYNNLGNTGSISFHNVARMNKNNLNDNEPNGIIMQNTNNQGCPLLTSIPMNNKEYLLNKQLCRNNTIDFTQELQNNCANINNNNRITLNQQNVQGCPQLLSIAQNSLNTVKNNRDYGSNQDFNCIDKIVQNGDCNCIQSSTPNDNLAQALKMVNRAKTANSPSTINILPYGEALLDGKPMSNNFVAVESVSCPAKLPTCTCSDSYSSNIFLTSQDVPSMPFPASPVNTFSCSTPLQASVPISTNVRLSPSPKITNIGPSVMNLTPSVPTISSITNNEFPMANLPVILSQEPSCNSNFQTIFTSLSKPNGISLTVTPNFIPIQSLPQVSFVNHLPSSTISVRPSLSLPDSCYSPISNLPSMCNSYQPVVSSSYPLVTTNLRANGLPRSSPVFPSLNNMVSSLTQNLLSKLMSQSSSGTPLAKLPPVNPFTPNLITGTSSMNSPVCLDISEPSNFIVSPLNLPALSLLNIPVACNEYLPPIYNPGMLPIPTFNPDLFCVGSNTAFDCGPFALSTAEAYYPYLS